MSRINTNVQSLVAQRILSSNTQSLNTSLERLSTGLRINRGKDDPAGLIASENLRSDLKGLNSAITNSERADQVATIAEGGLQEVSSLLTELQGLVTTTASSAGLSKEERQANQLQVDSILQTIDRISGSTSFQGTKLLNGGLDFTVSAVATGVTDFRINGAKFSGGSLNVNVLVTTSAQQGAVFLSAGAASIDLNTNSQFVVEVAGSLGSRQLSFASGTSLANIVSSINAYKDTTGVEAKVSGTGVRLFTSKYGKDEFVSVKVVNQGGLDTGQRGVYQVQSGNSNAALASSVVTFANSNNGVRDTGQDLGAFINGIKATSNGRTARINTDFLDVEITLNASTSQTLGSVGTNAFQITGGGAAFQFGGKVDINGKVAVGVQDVAVRKLGSSDTGFLDKLASGQSNNLVDGNINDAQKSISEAIKQVSSIRGRLGAFQKNTIGSTIRSLNIGVENTAAAQSVIRDSDFAAETAALTRSQILVSAATNTLGLANQSPQSVLQLLG